MIAVPGFHRHMSEWWGKVELRGKSKSGPVHKVDDIYLKEDEDRYREFVPVVCRRGDVRLTLGQILHGSRGKSLRRRRVVHPWLVGVDSDLETADLGGEWFMGRGVTGPQGPVTNAGGSYR